ncbi:MAG: permease [Candidatus Aminicenantes bacterium]|nr:permease [Candidatus Aminicenantes bacterium]
MKNKVKKEKEKKEWKSFYFLGFVMVLYIILSFLNPENAYDSFKASGEIFIKLIPVLFLVVLLMGLLNYFLRPKAVSKYLGKGSGIKGWLLAIFTGILSHGPIYVWYPLLKELRKQGMRTGLVAVFLYNRAIKIPLLPVMIYYFGIEFSIILLIWMAIASLIEGKVIEIIEMKLAF